MTKQRVACIGAGYFAQFHYDSWARQHDAIAVAACDQDIDRARATGLAAYSDLSAMLEAQTPDILDIILPPTAHAQVIRLAIALGVTRIICQKPFCRSLEEAHEIVAEAQACGACIVVHENFRFQPWYRVMRAAIDDGRIGTPRQLTFRLRPGDGQGPRAYLDRQPYFQQMTRFLVHETAVHWIDTFAYLFGLPDGVYADLRQLNPAIAGEDAGHILFDYADGRRALFDGNRLLDHDSDNPRRTMGEALIEGDGGTLTLQGDGAVRARAFGARREQTLSGPDRFDGFGGDCVHAFQTHAVAGFLGQAPLETEAGAYLNVIRTEEAIYASAARQARVSLTLA